MTGSPGGPYETVARTLRGAVSASRRAARQPAPGLLFQAYAARERSGEVRRAGPSDGAGTTVRAGGKRAGKGVP
ncbi:hypothetical protein [Streptomyces sp. NPDC006324]|uniref:hypothetical protein n=1 Tax=Streptomyces sp. NPDC006324 TaxID=3156751 RepID=UPI0033AE4B4C